VVLVVVVVHPHHRVVPLLLATAVVHLHHNRVAVVVAESLTFLRPSSGLWAQHLEGNKKISSKLVTVYGFTHALSSGIIYQQLYRRNQ
jgi:hypothetical protein